MIRLSVSVALTLVAVAALVEGPNGFGGHLRGVLDAFVAASMSEKKVGRTSQNHRQHWNAEAQPRRLAGKP